MAVVVVASMVMFVSRATEKNKPSVRRLIPHRQR